MKILGYEVKRLSNYAMGVEKEVLKKKVKVEVMPPSRTAKDIQDYVHALKAADAVNNPRRYMLYDLYQESIDYDAHLRAVLEKRVNALLQKQFIFIDEAGNEREDLSEWIESPKFRQFVRDILETRFWGHSLFEFYPGAWFDYQLIPRKNVEPRNGYVLQRSYDVTGVEFRTAKFAPYTMEVGNPDDFGLLKTATRYAIYKRNALSDWANYSELAGNNFQVFTYEGEDQAVRKQIDTLNEEGGVGMRMRLPKDVGLEVKSTSNSATTDLFERFHDFLNKEISKLFLGQTMTMEDGASRSQAEVHSEEQDTILSDDLTYVLNVLNYNFTDYRYLWDLPNGRFARSIESEDSPMVNEITPAGVQQLLTLMQSTLTGEQKRAALRVLFNIQESDANELIGNDTPEDRQEEVPTQDPVGGSDDTGSDQLVSE